MQTSNKERTLSWITNQYKKGNISFSHKLQRPIGLFFYALLPDNILFIG